MRQRDLKSRAGLIDASPLKALIFDLDGTLYRQPPLRWRMLRCALLAHVLHPARGLSTLRVLRAYRRAQETLRASPLAHRDLAEEQLQLASRWTGVGPALARACVARWMEQEPLIFLPRVRYQGVEEFLQVATARAWRLAVFSDYPATAKLRAMDLLRFFDVIVSAQDPEVRQFKPSPRGLEVTLGRLRVERHQAIYIADRPDIDAPAATAAGLACVIIGRRNVVDPRGWVEVSGYKALQEAICGG
jgi:phosphoglycolate phosphatase/putative hydrolase of the HAD superfamily